MIDRILGLAFTVVDLVGDVVDLFPKRKPSKPDPDAARRARLGTAMGEAARVSSQRTEQTMRGMGWSDTGRVCTVCDTGRVWQKGSSLHCDHCGLDGGKP